jgi:hypothetical protein
MVVRRCRRIVVLDASADADYVFDDLGGAIRKIRADLGVSIDFEKKVRIGKGADTSYYALFRIRYSGGGGAAGDPRDGRLLYVKPAVTGGEPMDIYHYRATNASFPHQSTADQFFSESQFESYRMLGYEIMDGVLEDAIENVVLMLQVGKYSPSMDRLSDLVRALDPKVIKETQDLYKQQEKSVAASA